MKNLMKTVFATGMMLFYSFSFGQSQVASSETLKDERIVQKSQMDFFFFAVGTNLNYGKSNASLGDYKKEAVGLQLGVTLQSGISPDFSLVSELYLIMKGGKLKEDNPLTDQEAVLRFYTVEVPVLARFHVGKFHLNAGLSLAYTFYGTQKLDGLTTDLSFGDESADFKRLDAGIQFGGGYSFQSKQKRVSIDIRYCHGLTNISHDNEIYNRSVLVRLHISKK